MLANNFLPEHYIILHCGDCLDFMKQIPDDTVQLIVTSPPYNLSKVYEKKMKMKDYIEWQGEVIRECHRVLKPTGSICWQVGNWVNKGAILPLDVVLHPHFAKLKMKMRNRIIWHFEHGLHCKNRFSGRYETINWYTKTDDYTFNLDPVRVPQKYPNKRYYKGPKAGQLSCNPLGKNPGDMWAIPNVKHNHCEKTEHPCQFPVELVERLVLALTQKDDWVFDPFAGVGSSLVAARKNWRRAVGAEIEPLYVGIAKDRIEALKQGRLPTRPMEKLIFE